MNLPRRLRRAKPSSGNAIASDASGIPDKAFFKIGATAKLGGVKPYVLRYWETEFKSVRPLKTRSQQLLYRKRDV